MAIRILHCDAPSLGLPLISRDACFPAGSGAYFHADMERWAARNQWFG